MVEGLRTEVRAEFEIGKVGRHHVCPPLPQPRISFLMRFVTSAAGVAQSGPSVSKSGRVSERCGCAFLVGADRVCLLLLSGFGLRVWGLGFSGFGVEDTQALGFRFLRVWG